MSVSTAVMGPRSTSARCGRGEAANWARKEWKIVAHLGGIGRYTEIYGDLRR